MNASVVDPPRFAPLSAVKESGSTPGKSRCAGVPPAGWHSTEGWQPVAVAAMRAAHAAHCSALVLGASPQHEEAARFLLRRAGILVRLAESLALESRCEDRLRNMSPEAVLAGMMQAEEQLADSVHSLLCRKGIKLQMFKLLEQESLMGRASRARVALARLDCSQPSPAASN